MLYLNVPRFSKNLTKKEALNDYSEIIIQKLSAEGNNQNSYVKKIILFRIIHLLEESNDRTPQKMDDLTVILANAIKAMDKLASDSSYLPFVCLTIRPQEDLKQTSV